MARPILALCALLVAGGFAAAYVANTFLYLTPPNPVKLHLHPIIYALEHPYFSQNWHLFAPNPVRTNFLMAVRCRLKDGSVTIWHDPVTPLMAVHHRSRWTPMGKVLRLPQNAIFAFLGRNTDEWRPLLCKQRPTLPMCRGDDPTSKAQRDLGEFMLIRLASAACDEWLGPGRTAVVRVRLLHHKPPPISQRHLLQEAGTITYFTLPWKAYQAWR